MAEFSFADLANNPSWVMADAYATGQDPQLLLERNRQAQVQQAQMEEMNRRRQADAMAREQFPKMLRNMGYNDIAELAASGNMELALTMLDSMRQKAPALKANPVTGEYYLDDGSGNPVIREPVRSGGSDMTATEIDSLPEMLPPPPPGLNPKQEQLWTEEQIKNRIEQGVKDKSKAEGQRQFKETIGEFRNEYNKLKEEGGVISEKQGGLDNAINSMARSDLGSYVGEIFGTKEAVIAKKIRSAKPLLLQSIMQATGMTAKQLDSNTELKMYLDSLGDPSIPYETNMAILDKIEKQFGGSVSSPFSNMSDDDIMKEFGITEEDLQ